jgi:hypothetical protein
LMKKHTFVAPKITRFCMLLDSKIRNNFPFEIKFKFETEFELKILEEEPFLKLN